MTKTFSPGQKNQQRDTVTITTETNQREQRAHIILYIVIRYARATYSVRSREVREKYARRSEKRVK